MRLTEYLKTISPKQRERLASLCGTSVAYFYQLSGGHRMPSLNLILKLESATDGKVARPDWPIEKRVA